MSKKVDVSKGDEVAYRWGKGTVDGKVTKVHTDTIAKTIKGAEIKREASNTKPAIEIETEKGAKVLKSISEVKIK